MLVLGKFHNMILKFMQHRICEPVITEIIQQFASAVCHHDILHVVRSEVQVV